MDIKYYLNSISITWLVFRARNTTISIWGFGYFDPHHISLAPKSNHQLSFYQFTFWAESLSLQSYTVSVKSMSVYRHYVGLGSFTSFHLLNVLSLSRYLDHQLRRKPCDTWHTRYCISWILSLNCWTNFRTWESACKGTTCLCLRP